MKVLLTGARGFVGHKLKEALPDAVCAPSLRGADKAFIKRMVEESGAEVIIHTAAISDTRECELQPDESYAANVLLPVMLAEASAGRKLICLSSDQVYNGSSLPGAYTEADAAPVGVYATHKLEMEQRVADISPDAVLLRAEWMYDFLSPRGNYFLGLINAAGTLKCSSRQYRGLTYLREVADNTEAVMRLPGGVYNFGSEADGSMLDITKEILAYLGRNTEVEDTAPAHNLHPDCSKAKKHGIIFSPVSVALKKCADDYLRYCSIK